LSHFLWGKSPDEELLKLAADGSIGNSRVLTGQVERLLDDDQSSKLYPEYDDVLHHSLLEETHAFVAEMIEQDLPITNVVDSNFTFLNSRLARHYNIDWPGGTGLKRVKLKRADRRGGIITHGSVLKVTANGTATSPILRGVWMLERVVRRDLRWRVMMLSVAIELGIGRWSPKTERLGGLRVSASTPRTRSLAGRSSVTLLD